MKLAVKNARMKTLAALLVAGMVPLASQAEPMSKDRIITTGFGATFGAIAGGPIGFVAGSMIGAILGENVEKTNELESKEIAMDQATQEISILEQQIFQMDLAMDGIETEVTQLEEALLTRLEFQVLFRTGDDRLRDEDRERIAMLAKYMQRNPEVNVKLEGHTDARGTDEYNNILAGYRARAVADALIMRGIASDRVQIQSLGASKASAEAGDYEGYALDRHVNIEVVGENLGHASIAQTSEELALAQ